jgi:integral membrane protein
MLAQLLTTTLGRFRIVAFAEGLSYLILLFVAMPLKYVFGMPSAVRAFGTVHGALFVFYIVWVLICHLEYSWPWRKTLLLLLVSVVPFGNFYADKHWLRSPNA